MFSANPTKHIRNLINVKNKQHKEIKALKFTKVSKIRWDFTWFSSLNLTCYYWRHYFCYTFVQYTNIICKRQNELLHHVTHTTMWSSTRIQCCIQQGAPSSREARRRQLLSLRTEGRKGNRPVGSQPLQEQNSHELQVPIELSGPRGVCAVNR